MPSNNKFKKGKKKNPIVQKIKSTSELDSDIIQIFKLSDRNF